MIFNNVEKSFDDNFDCAASSKEYGVVALNNLKVQAYF